MKDEIIASPDDFCPRYGEVLYCGIGSNELAVRPVCSKVSWVLGASEGSPQSPAPSFVGGK